MEPNDNVFDTMYMLINKYLNDTWGVGLYAWELKDVIELLRTCGDSLCPPAKIKAIKYVREATRRTEAETFKLDLSNHEGTPISDFTAWVTLHNVDMATSEVKASYLGLNKVKDLIEFIQLNLRHLVG